MFGRGTLAAAFTAAAIVGAACKDTASGGECPTGSNGCACTAGGGCDPNANQ